MNQVRSRCARQERVLVPLYPRESCSLLQTFASTACLRVWQTLLHSCDKTPSKKAVLSLLMCPRAPSLISSHVSPLCVLGQSGRRCSPCGTSLSQVLSHLRKSPLPTFTAGDCILAFFWSCSVYLSRLSSSLFNNFLMKTLNSLSAVH